MTADEIFAVLKKELAIDSSQFAVDTPLFSSGLLDSFAMVTLVTALEARTGVRVRATEVTLENFDSVSRISRFLAGRGK